MWTNFPAGKTESDMETTRTNTGENSLGRGSGLILFRVRPRIATERKIPQKTNQITFSAEEIHRNNPILLTLQQRFADIFLTAGIQA